MAGKLKNYTTKVPASRSIQQVQDALANAGASAVMMDIDTSTGRIQGLTFVVAVNGLPINFQLPVDCPRFKAALLEDRVSRAEWDDDYVYRVAWRCIRDWVMAQMALVRTQMVELEQVFLPYAVSQSGGTIYQAIMGGDVPLLTGGIE